MLHSHLKQLGIPGLAAIMLAGCTPMTTHYREIPTPDLPYIAMIRLSRAESTEVVYNSEICREIGEACGFFRSQAYAHLMLNHRPYLPPDNYPPSYERDADCWAARNADREVVAAAVQLLSDSERVKNLPIIGDPAERARNIRECAIAAGNWAA